MPYNAHYLNTLFHSWRKKYSLSTVHTLQNPFKVSTPYQKHIPYTPYHSPQLDAWGIVRSVDANSFRPHRASPHTVDTRWTPCSYCPGWCTGHLWIWPSRRSAERLRLVNHIPTLPRTVPLAPCLHNLPEHDRLHYEPEQRHQNLGNFQQYIFRASTNRCEN